MSSRCLPICLTDESDYFQACRSRDGAIFNIYDQKMVRYFTFMVLSLIMVLTAQIADLLQRLGLRLLSYPKSAQLKSTGSMLLERAACYRQLHMFGSRMCPRCERRFLRLHGLSKCVFRTGAVVTTHERQYRWSRGERMHKYYLKRQAYVTDDVKQRVT
jgi:hypothetical protein